MSELRNRLDLLFEVLRDEAILHRAGFYARQIIQERTLRGEFLRSDKGDYDEAYAEKRQQRGLQTSHVDLQFSGSMWGSFDHNVDAARLEIELGFNRDELARIASYHDVHGAGRNKIIREFLGLTEAEQEELTNYLMQEYSREIDVLMTKNLPEL